MPKTGHHVTELSNFLRKGRVREIFSGLTLGRADHVESHVLFLTGLYVLGFPSRVGPLLPGMAYDRQGQRDIPAMDFGGRGVQRNGTLLLMPTFDRSTSSTEGSLGHPRPS